MDIDEEVSNNADSGMNTGGGDITDTNETAPADNSTESGVSGRTGSGDAAEAGTSSSASNQMGGSDRAETGPAPNPILPNVNIDPSIIRYERNGVEEIIYIVSDDSSEELDNAIEENDDDEESLGSTVIHFDTNLPAEHSYLGENMNRVSGVEYLEAGRVHRLMLFLHQHIVYPGEVIPFMIPGFIIDADIDSDNGLLFGVAFPHVRCPKTDDMYGVTCQIYEKGTDDRGNTLIKSRALQRFITTNDTRREHLEYITTAPQLKTFGFVRILPEHHLPEPLSTINLGSMSRFRDIPRLEHYIRDFQATTTIWPKYVYNQYNIKTVIDKVFKSLEAHKVESMPNDPIQLSFWLSRNSHFCEEKLKSIFITDSVNLRMRIIADSFNDGGVFACRLCKNQIALCQDLFAMSKHGVQSQYCNSAGYIHETNTVYKVFKKSVVFSGQPSSEFSWFPGYQWRIIICKNCDRHIGWQFRANSPDLTPVIFYGITGASVQIQKENQTRNRRTRTDPVLNTLMELVGL